MKIKAIIYLLVLSLCLVSFAGCAKKEGNEKTKKDDTEYKDVESELMEDNIINVTEDNVRFMGRTYKNEKDGAYYFNWTASGFEFTFEGTRAEAELVTNPTEKPERWPSIYVFVDGKEEPDEGKVITVKPDETNYLLAEDLKPGKHTIKVIKRNGNIIGGNIFEDPSLASTVGVKSLNLPGGKLLAPSAAKERKLEFIGDSITVGMGVQGEGDDGWRTYAAYAARALDADMNVQAISGMGLICSIFGDKFIELPDEFPYVDRYSNPGDKWDHSKYLSDVVVVNLGTNDSAGVGEGKKYSEKDFEDGYFNFIMEIKSKYPDCKVIAAFGAMGRDYLFPSIENAVARANEAQGEKFAYFLKLVENQQEDGVGGGGHPSAKAHEKHGKALAALIKDITGWE